MADFEDICKSLDCLSEDECGFFLVIGEPSKTTEFVEFYAKHALKSIHSCNGPLTDSITQITGYKDLEGNYHSSPLVDAAEDGGIFLIEGFKESKQGLIHELHPTLERGMVWKGTTYGYKRGNCGEKDVCDEYYATLGTEELQVREGFMIIATSHDVDGMDLSILDRSSIFRIE